MRIVGIVYFIVPIISSATSSDDAWEEDAEFWKGDDEQMLKLLEQEGIDTDRCDFAAAYASEFSVDEFASEYKHKPLLMKGGAAHWPAIREDRLQRGAFLRIAGSMSAEIQRGLGVSVFGPGGGLPGTLFTFADQMRHEPDKSVIFDLQGQDIARHFGAYWDHPPQILESFRNSRGSFLSMAGPGAGLPMHAHGETWLGLAFGKKLWMVLPPDGPADEDAYWKLAVLPMKTIFQRRLLSASQRPMFCVQEPGDIVYLPAFWWHATMNLGESIGIGDQNNIWASLDASVVRQLSAQYPRSGIFIRLRTQMAMFEGDIAGASRLFKEGLELEPANWHHRREYAIEMDNKQPGMGAKILKQAAADLSKAKADGWVLEDDALEVLANLAHGARWIGDYKLCLQFVNKIVKQGTKNENVLYMGTRCAIRAGDKKEAQKFINTRLVMARNKDDVKELKQLAGWLKDQSDDPVELARAAEQLFDTPPIQRYIRLGIALCLTVGAISLHVDLKDWLRRAFLKFMDGFQRGMVKGI